MEKVKSVDLPAKVKVRTPTIYIRSVAPEIKKKFYSMAKALGYTPREYFEKLIEKQ